jgi:hypothetical protein
VSRDRLMQLAFGSITFAFPLTFFQRGSSNNNSPRTFRYHLEHRDLRGHPPWLKMGTSCKFSLLGKKICVRYLIGRMGFVTVILNRAKFYRILSRVTC